MAFFDISLDLLHAHSNRKNLRTSTRAGNPRSLKRGFPFNAFEKWILPVPGNIRRQLQRIGGQPVKGWLILPSQRTGKLPCVVEYIGYGGGRSFPTDWLLWASAGYAHFVMDTRGQGSAWSAGDTPDLYAEGGNAHFPGSMTKGILDPKHYYYRRVLWMRSVPLKRRAS
jgi:hypothetical protein